MPDGCSLPDGSETWVVVRTAGPLVYRKLIAAKTFERTLVQRRSLRARAALTTFKTLKTDRGTGL